MLRLLCDWQRFAHVTHIPHFLLQTELMPRESKDCVTLLCTISLKVRQRTKQAVGPDVFVFGRHDVGS